ncbi:hypothetical protein [Halosimplex pelagicum]|uniref:DUF8149 domain-containing protein n=1 Tax=Halosimplex pelagicum TaxID=869886 RepID=A0A7D5PA42_9EURY|nr:hypothetical protein [Halosimplex pelagicum]QLH82624.1 hypothetical protein HZS54_13780 [Halosimplex pelagicum]
MADDTDPTVPVVCSECETETAVAIDDVADAVERHNDGLHGGEQVARVDPALADQVRDLVAEDLGLLGDPDDD